MCVNLLLQSDDEESLDETIRYALESESVVFVSVVIISHSELWFFSSPVLN